MKKGNYFKKGIVILLAFICMMSFVACGKEKELELTPENLAGTWVRVIKEKGYSDATDTIEINEDLTMVDSLYAPLETTTLSFDTKYTYQLEGNKLITYNPEYKAYTEYEIELTENQMTMTKGNETKVYDRQ